MSQEDRLVLLAEAMGGDVKGLDDRVVILEGAGGGGGGSVPAAGGWIETYGMGAGFEAAAFAQQTYATRAIAQQDFTIERLGILLPAVNSTNPTIELGVYSDAGVLLTSQTFVPTGPGVWSVALTTPVDLVQGQVVWLAMTNRSNETTTTAVWHNSGGLLNGLMRFGGGTATMPATLPTDSTGRSYYMFGSGPAVGAPGGVPDGVVIGTGVSDIVALTQAAYDAIEAPDPNTLYVTVG